MATNVRTTFSCWRRRASVRRKSSRSSSPHVNTATPSASELTSGRITRAARSIDFRRFVVTALRGYLLEVAFRPRTAALDFLGFRHLLEREQQRLGVGTLNGRGRLDRFGHGPVRMREGTSAVNRPREA